MLKTCSSKRVHRLVSSSASAAKSLSERNPVVVVVVFGLVQEVSITKPLFDSLLTWGFCILIFVSRPSLKSLYLCEAIFLLINGSVSRRCNPGCIVLVHVYSFARCNAIVAKVHMIRSNTDSVVKLVTRVTQYN